MAVFVARARDHLVTSGVGTDLFYQPGRIQLLGVNSFGSVVCIAEVGDNLLVCLPNSVWDKKKDQRLLPGSAFKKGIAVSVAAVAPDLRDVVLDSSLKVWIGLLSVDAEKFLDFAEVGAVDKSFGTEDMELLPYGESLVAVAAEHFTFLSAEEGPQVIPVVSAEEDIHLRMEKVEGALSGIQLALERLAQPQQTRGRPSALKQSGGDPLYASPKRGSKSKVNFDGLDKEVVDAALQAGVEVDQLTEVAQFLRAQPRRMEDLPRPQGSRAAQDLSESEDSSEDEEGEETPGQSSSGDGGVAKAIVKLTALADSRKKQKQDNIESLLDQSNLGQSSDASGLGGGRRNAQALRALKRCLSENPDFIYRSIEANLLADFSARPVKPGAPMGQTTARGWLESRSRIQNYTTHVRWSWAVAGIWDDLMRGEHGSARARAALLIAASDQAAIDGGSWLLSNVSMLEPLPPFQSFSSHQAPSSQELQHSALWDPRWFELFLAHVKEMDSYQETRKKLSKPVPKVKPEENPKSPKSPKHKAKAKASSGREEESATS